MAGRFTHILVPTDFSPASDAALACAKELALRFDARLTLLHVVTDPVATGAWAPDVYVAASAEMGERFLRTTTERLEAALTPEERVRFAVRIEAWIGVPAQIIEDIAREQKVDLIVMGTHGRRGAVAHVPWQRRRACGPTCALPGPDDPCRDAPGREVRAGGVTAAQ